MKRQKCVQCGAETTLGDIRSGVISFGAHFLEYEEGSTDRGGKPRVRSGVNRNNRVVAYACGTCGYISNYLERVVAEA